MLEGFLIGAWNASFVFLILGFVWLFKYLKIKRTCSIYCARIAKIDGYKDKGRKRTYFVNLEADYEVRHFLNGNEKEIKTFTIKHEIADSIKKPKHNVIENGTYNIFWNSEFKEYHDISIKNRWWQYFLVSIAGFIGSPLLLYVIAYLISLWLVSSLI